MDTIPKDTNPKNTIPNEHDSKWTQFRVTPPEWIRSRMDTIPNGHDPKVTRSRMDPGRHPERTLSRTDTTYIITEVLYTYAW